MDTLSEEKHDVNRLTLELRLVPQEGFEEMVTLKGLIDELVEKIHQAVGCYGYEGTSIQDGKWVTDLE